ncbi:hypothetical protein FAM09_01190 [Niastella caeni]|uniref:Uncharacterized protein n=1 Tax=Niastella caeni TaxID=2569763 RepID=A0A4S8HY85_9BACT|nr:hypothetical protein [Niastella caeni]THU40758.1 hypothetical protein FAM09_01190 [Niastella caeni]
MPYFMVTVKESKAGARRRRKLVVACNSKPEAMISIQDLCRGTGFIPDYKTVGEITSYRYFRIVGTLLGRCIDRAAT